MKKILGAAAAALLTVTVLAGCGGGSNSSDASSTGSNGSSDSSGSSGSNGSGNYCDDIKSTSTALKGLSGADLTGDKFSQVNDAVHSIADEAPSEIKGSWLLIANEFDSLQQTMSDAGLSMDDFGKLSSGKMPAGFDVAKLQALEKKLQSINTKGITAAANKIQTQVKSDCGIDINNTSS